MAQVELARQQGSMSISPLAGGVRGNRSMDVSESKQISMCMNKENNTSGLTLLSNFG